MAAIPCKHSLVNQYVFFKFLFHNNCPQILGDTKEAQN